MHGLVSDPEDADVLIAGGVHLQNPDVPVVGGTVGVVVSFDPAGVVVLSTGVVVLTVSTGIVALAVPLALSPSLH